MPLAYLRSRARTGIGMALVVLLATGAAHAQRDQFAAPRNKLVDDAIVREGIKNDAVIKAMRTVPRHEFVRQQDKQSAYIDQALPIGHKQTISPPFIVAYMTEMLDPQPTDKVLEIGTGSGYQAAVLSGIVKDVYTIEIVEALGKTAARKLKDLKYSNVHCKIGDGYQGWPEQAPFDKIIVTCSPESVPQPLVDQLREGGRLIVPLGERYEQVFYLFEKKDGALVKNRLIPTLFVPMTGVSEDNRKVKPDPTRPQIHNGGFETEDDDGRPPGWHYQRQLTLQKSEAPEGSAYATFDNQEPGRGAMALQAVGVDGTKVSSLKVSVRARGQKLVAGSGPAEQPALNIQFYDGEMNAIDFQILGPWQGTFDWKGFTKIFLVPPQTRHAILRVGLNGGTGKLSIDDVQLQAVPRQ